MVSRTFCSPTHGLHSTPPPHRNHPSLSPVQTGNERSGPAPRPNPEAVSLRPGTYVLTLLLPDPSSLSPTQHREEGRGLGTPWRPARGRSRNEFEKGWAVIFPSRSRPPESNGDPRSASPPASYQVSGPIRGGWAVGRRWLGAGLFSFLAANAWIGPGPAPARMSRARPG